MEHGWLEGQTTAVRHWLAASKCPMLVSTADGSFLWVNEATENLFGYSAVEFLGIGHQPGLSWQSLTVDSQDLSADMAMVAALMAGERTEYSLEKAYRAKDGRPVPTKIHVLRWPPDGECECFLVTVLPLDAQNEMLRDEVIAMRHALAEFIADQKRPKPVPLWWTAMGNLATWADQNRLPAALVVLFFLAFFFGDRALEIGDRMSGWLRGNP